MSIPPLVCSTPPPPDQCEDDKEPEDFELSYNLSQEDEDYENNGFNYGNFTSYNNFQSSPDNGDGLLERKDNGVTKNENSVVSNEIIKKYENIELEHNVIETSDINENKLKCEDEINVEDLNLEVEKEIENIIESNIEEINVNEQNIDGVEVFGIPCNTNNESRPCDTTNTSSPFDETATDECDASKKSTPFTEEKPLSTYVEAADISVQENSFSSVGKKKSVEFQETLSLSEDDGQIGNIGSKSDENDVIDDDFDDFQSGNIESNATKVLESIDNPWQDVDCNEPEFGNFTANFEEIKFQDTQPIPPDSEHISTKLEQLVIETEDKADSHFDDDDDFGDFDDFKLSSIKTKPTEALQCHELPVLNLQLAENEHQIMERIAKVVSSIFLEELSEPVDKFEGKLESLLSETWCHLKETDERQPYIVNWNNSFGQKTLLKALCIDSRNILFGPKWSSNMPKFAANLSNAPLQPQKQTSAASSIAIQNDTISGKSAVKPMSWRDPFTSDGQESCSIENESAAITPGPTDLDVFEASAPVKPDKIFSNTMGVQPLRQINLPDTHIFTPTDSEIPRSKTIHYDSSPNVLLHQSTMADNQEQKGTQNNTDRVVENNNDDSEYWEFQKFKSSDTSSSPGNSSNSPAITQEKSYETATTVSALPQPSVAYQTELLQPIKVEPAIPTLNWPDPGEVKCVFDDFSDFVSTSSQPGIQQNDTSISAEQSFETIKPSISALNRIPSVPDATLKFSDNDGIDDDFDTFQSAYPTKDASDNSNTCYSSKVSNQISSSEFLSRVSKVDSIKSDTILFTNPLPNETLTPSVGHINTTELTISKNLLPLSSLLQPTPASFSPVSTHSQQKSGQILQPLSLESYSQINWPSPGIDLQDLSRFNPVETLQSLKSETSINGPNKGGSPVHANKVPDDDVWGEFVSSKPKQAQASQPKKPSDFVDDDEWTDFISSPSVQPQNGLNTISLNVHTNSNIHKSVQNKLTKKHNQPPIDIPSLNYITPKSNHHKSYNDKHFQNL